MTKFQPNIRLINEWDDRGSAYYENGEYVGTKHLPWGRISVLDIGIGHSRSLRCFWDYLDFSVIVLGIGFNISFS